MTKQQKTALNMAKFIQNQSLLLLEKLNELDLLDLDVEADLCEKLHDDAEHLFRTLTSRLDALQDGN
ncbi:Rop family plasmid primer RNA-binding protein [Klebsiella pneumoniae]|uniref:Rop family plasmid primer RNA-binding protein n=1 Tax=Klebsiella pneumoniae TaxID=573 RepID=UPI000D74410E|nr:Rop family plasmid primer RNA-binding protein [Klebsiella pneumoniae]PXI84416.1 Rop family plasmid primer RNA-binding protein [Klebsiella pneumoniae]